MAAEDLNDKIGPLPAWAWGGIIVGGVLIFHFIRSRQQAASVQVPAPGADATADPTASDNGATSSEFSANPYTQAYQDYITSDPTNPAYPVSVGGSSGVPAPITDAQWGRVASDGLIGQGNDPTIVTSAITKYLSGQSLSAAEDAVIGKALQLFGSPPEGALPILFSPTPVTQTPPPVPSLPAAPTPQPEPVPQPTPSPPVPISYATQEVAALTNMGIKASLTPQSGPGWGNYGGVWVYNPGAAGGKALPDFVFSDLAMLDGYTNDAWKQKALTSLQTKTPMTNG